MADREPNRRPWKAERKERIESCGEPGDWLFIADDISSAVKSTFSPRSWRRRYMKTALKAVSLASDPAVAVKT